MPRTSPMPVGNLSLDLANFRTIPQVDEVKAIQAMVSISPGNFWALMESLLDSGYLPTENILVLDSGAVPPVLMVKEGNRRIAALKLILGHVPSSIVTLPDSIESRIASLPSGWIASNESVPCTIYPVAEADVVDRIVALAHGKGEKAGRDQWTAVARARHSRDVGGSSEPALDLLETYLKHGRNRSPEQADRWAGDYPVTVLDEAIKRISTRFGVSNAPELARKYPAVPHRDALESILLNIGLKNIRFETIRRADGGFPESYGVPSATPTGSGGGNSPQSGSGSASNRASNGTNGSNGGAAGGGAGQSSGASSAQGGGQPSGGAGAQSGPGGTGGTGKKPGAVPLNDPRAIRRALKDLKPVGNNRNKVVTLCLEARRLDLDKNPFAFCFLLRSMFEISAKAYCDDHQANGGPSPQKNGKDKKLTDLLEDITQHLTQNNANLLMVKKLHGALTELKKPEGLLSVTSMNQLVHNPSFSVAPGDICVLFGNIFPLLEAMNQ